MLDQLSKPLTEIEKGELTAACQKVLTPAGMMLLRRLMFCSQAIADAGAERDAQESLDTYLIAEIARLTLKLEAMKGGPLPQRLAVMLAEPTRRAEWQPISTAPKDGTRVLLHGKDAFADHREPPFIGSWSGDWDDDYERYWRSVTPGCVTRIEPTHWQPLPEPPAAMKE